MKKKLLIILLILLNAIGANADTTFFEGELGYGDDFIMGSTPLSTDAEDSPDLSPSNGKSFYSRSDDVLIYNDSLGNRTSNETFLPNTTKIPPYKARKDMNLSFIALFFFFILCALYFKKWTRFNKL